MDDIISLKEQKKVLQAACGEGNINRNTLSKQEKVALNALRRNLNTREMLRDVNERIHDDEVEFRSDYQSTH